MHGTVPGKRRGGRGKHTTRRKEDAVVMPRIALSLGAHTRAATISWLSG